MTNRKECIFSTLVVCSLYLQGNQASVNRNNGKRWPWLLNLIIAVNRSTTLLVLRRSWLYKKQNLYAFWVFGRDRYFNVKVQTFVERVTKVRKKISDTFWSLKSWKWLYYPGSRKWNKWQAWQSAMPYENSEGYAIASETPDSYTNKRSIFGGLAQ